MSTGMYGKMWQKYGKMDISSSHVRLNANLIEMGIQFMGIILLNVEKYII
jgi:hypothetical protein